LPLAFNSTYYERRLAVGRAQLAQGSTSPWSRCEWASLLLLAEVQTFSDRAERAAVALLMMGHADATASRVRVRHLACLRAPLCLDCAPCLLHAAAR
jgi:hypothetical protein